MIFSKFVKLGIILIMVSSIYPQQIDYRNQISEERTRWLNLSLNNKPETVIEENIPRDIEKEFRYWMTLGSQVHLESLKDLKHQLDFEKIYITNEIKLQKNYFLIDIVDSLLSNFDEDLALELFLNFYEYSTINSGYTKEIDSEIIDKKVEIISGVESITIKLRPTPAQYWTGHVWRSAIGTYGKVDNTITVGKSSLGATSRGWALFNTTVIPRNAIIQSARLGVYCNSPSSSSNHRIVVKNLFFHPNPVTATNLFNQIGAASIIYANNWNAMTSIGYKYINYSAAGIQALQTDIELEDFHGNSYLEINEDDAEGKFDGWNWNSGVNPEPILEVTYILSKPTVSTNSASSITSRSARLNGTVNPNGSSTNYYFQYGKTTNYGTMTSLTSAGSGTSNVTVNANIDYLEAGTQYNYRIVAENAYGVSYGSNITFTTTALTINMTAPSSNITVTQGSNVTLTWSGSPSSGTSLSLYWDNDRVWGNGGGGIIAVSQPISGSYSWNTSGYAPGIYHLVAYITDGSTYKYSYASGSVTVTGLPDLTVINPAGPGTAAPGSEIDISCTVVNNGPGNSGAHRVGYYLATTQYGQDTFLGFDLVDPLLAGYGSIEAKTLTIPSSTVPGSYWIAFYADYQNVIDETNENNNINSYPITIQNNYTLTITQPSGNITVTQGQSINIEWTGSPSGAMVQLWRDIDNVWSNGNETLIDLLLPATGSYSWNTTSVPLGTYYIAGAITVGGDLLHKYAVGTVTIQSSNLTVNVKNIDSKSIPFPGNNGTVNLFDNNWVQVGSQNTTNGVALFQNIPAVSQANGYKVKVYHSPQPPTYFGTEYWGFEENIPVLGNSSNDFNFTRNLPYADSVWVELNGQNVTGGTVPSSSVLTLKVRLRNPFEWDLQARTRLIVDRDKSQSTGWDFNQFSAYQTIIGINNGTNNFKVYSFTFTPTEVGSYYNITGTTTNVYGEVGITDGTDWHVQPIIIVSDQNLFDQLWTSIKDYDNEIYEIHLWNEGLINNINRPLSEIIDGQNLKNIFFKNSSGNVIYNEGIIDMLFKTQSAKKFIEYNPIMYQNAINSIDIAQVNRSPAVWGEPYSMSVMVPFAIFNWWKEMFIFVPLGSGGLDQPSARRNRYKEVFMDAILQQDIDDQDFHNYENTRRRQTILRGVEIPQNLVTIYSTIYYGSNVLYSNIHTLEELRAFNTHLLNGQIPEPRVNEFLGKFNAILNLITIPASFYADGLDKLYMQALVTIPTVFERLDAMEYFINQYGATLESQLVNGFYDAKHDLVEMFNNYLSEYGLGEAIRDAALSDPNTIFRLINFSTSLASVFGSSQFATALLPWALSWEVYKSIRNQAYTAQESCIAANIFHLLNSSGIFNHFIGKLNSQIISNSDATRALHLVNMNYYLGWYAYDRIIRIMYGEYIYMYGNPLNWIHVQNFNTFMQNLSDSRENLLKYTHITSNPFYLARHNFGLGINDTDDEAGFLLAKLTHIMPSIPLPNELMADFNVTPSSGTQPLLCNFEDNSLGQGINSWIWNFGDGQNDSGQAALHTYNNWGIYYPFLTISNGVQFAKSNSKIIQVSPQQPLADFTAGAIFGIAPLLVNFINNSQFAASYQWIFGDGSSSTQVNPIHVYDEPGTYTVTLIAYNTGGQNIMTKSAYINVSGSTGNLTINTNNENAGFIAQGSITLVGGGLTQSFNNIPIGTYNISFNPIPGYIRPLDTSVVLLTGMTLQLNVNYFNNNIPTLIWTQEVGYESDGVDPNEGRTFSTFTFRVKYTDQDGDVPLSGFPKVHIKKGGTAITNSPFTMTAANSNPFTSGRIYTVDINNLEAGNDYTFYFQAYDVNGNLAIGEATVEQNGPVVTSNLSPVVTISYPMDGQIVADPNINVQGTAQDPAEIVMQVQLKLNSGSWEVASGTTNWSHPVVLTDGVNTICARAVDDEGTYSQEICVSVTHFALPENWTNLNPVPQGNTLRSVFFINNTTGWMAGSGGLILKTTNTGEEWIQQVTNTGTALKAIYFIDEFNGWAVGELGIILNTNNGGNTWIQQSSNVSANLNAVKFINSSTGWAVGYNGTILKTSNGGASWVSQSSGVTTALFDIDFYDANVLIAVGGYTTFTGGPPLPSTILKTTNGGSTWSDKNSSYTVYGLLYGVEIINNNLIWVCGQAYALYKSIDGGENWSYNSSGKNMSPEQVDGMGGFRDIFFKDNNFGYALGGEYQSNGFPKDRKIIMTTDGGNSWSNKLNQMYENNLFSLFITNDNKGISVGSNGVILKSTDNGNTWKQQLSGSGIAASVNINSVWFLNPNIGFAVGERMNYSGGLPGGAILKTTNGGKDWLITNFIGNQGDYLVDIFLINENTGWTIFNNISPFPPSSVLKTTNGGNTWDSYSIGSDYGLRSIFFVDENNGWITSQSGIYASTNGGTGWTKRNNLSSSSAFFFNPNIGFVASSTGVYRTNDGGTNWTQKSNVNSSSIYFVDSNTGWFVGGGGVIYKTTDGGENWLSKPSGTTEGLNDIHFSDFNNGLSAGGNGTLIKTTDGGESWQKITTGTSQPFNTVKVNNPSLAWAAGWDGLMLGYSNSSIPFITNVSPTQSETLFSGQVYNITWNSQNIFNFKIDYSTNNGYEWLPISNSISGNIHSWIVPNTPSQNCRIKVQSLENPNVFGISLGEFTIVSTNQSPLLTFTGESGFETDGVDPNEGNTLTEFIFKVKYMDADSDAPLTGYPKVYVKKAGVNIIGSPYTMSEVVVKRPTENMSKLNLTGEGTILSRGEEKSESENMLIEDFVDGVIYQYLISSLETGNDYTYYFQAYDSNNNVATGQATIEQLGPNVLAPIEQFTLQPMGLNDVFDGSVEWGDYDNDGNLDLLLTGTGDILGPAPITNLYQNEGNSTFTLQALVDLSNVTNSSVAWGDYDNDGDLDILLTGNDWTNRVAKIYRNEGNNVFTEQTQIQFAGVSSSSVAWGDYDNDGDLDILLTGFNGSENKSLVYRNDGNSTFSSPSTISLTNISSGSVAWGDYDNDGHLDILLTGSTSGSKIFRNSGNGEFEEQISINLIGVSSSSGAWGDYNNDGYLDILITGQSGSSRVSKIYKNNGNNTFSEVTTTSLIGVSNGTGIWGDYDNDGKLDIILSGNILDYSLESVTKVYKNIGNDIFSEQSSISLVNIGGSSIKWGDYDNDGDLDLILTGFTNNGSPVSRIYRNNNPTPNTLPSVPTNLKSTINGQSITLNWNKSTDNETAQNGLTYNLRIGTTPGGCEIMSPMSDPLTGKRKIVALGNTNHNNSWTIKGLEPGLYYWSVQAIDNCFAGSQFSIERYFVIPEQIVANYPVSFFVNDNAGGITSLDAGIDITATTGIDPHLGEINLPPFPPQGVFEARWSLQPFGVGNLSAYRDYRSPGDPPAFPFTGQITHRLVWQYSEFATQMSFTYNLPPEATLLITSNNATPIWTSGTLTGSGTYTLPDPDNEYTAARVFITYTVAVSALNQPIWAVSPISLNFSNVAVGSDTVLPITVSNIGDAPLIISDIVSSNSQYTFSPNLFPIIIPEGGAQIFNVIFTPTAGGVLAGTLTFIHNALGSPTSYSVQGTGIIPSIIPYFTDFETFITGQQVACQDPINWTTWNSLPCDTNQDAYISSNYTFTGTKSVLIVHNNDLLKPLLAQNSGKWRISFVNYIPTGKTGYFNTFALVAGVNSKWGMECYFNSGGAGILNAGGANSASFAWIPDFWKRIEVIVDLDNDFAEFWYDNIMIYSWQWTLGAFGLGCPLQLDASNFFGATATDEMYLDDYKIEQVNNIFPLSLAVSDGWNMVSVPGMHPVDQNVNTWWQYRDPSANVFKFSGGYQPIIIATPTEGYWMKHSGNRLYNTGDEWPAEGIQIAPNDPIPGVTGWNLIGGYQNTVAAAGLTTAPDGLISGQVFGYTPGTGYSIVTSLVPGNGYWIKLTGAGQINIPTSLAKSSPTTEYIKSDWGRIILTDAAGKSYTLYAVNGEVDLNQYELPPMPPAGMFDVRYGSQRMAEEIGSEIQTIQMSGIEYPVTVRIEGMTIRVQDETGKIVNAVLKTGEDVVISNPMVEKLKVSGNTIPETYSLEQNYPNPFNPSTMIEFSIPEDVENVKLTIYDALGQKVAELVNGKLEAGRYSYQWDASRVASGIYIYRLSANKFVSTKKMVLIR